MNINRQIRGIMKTKTLVSKVGFPEDYLNLPVVKNDIVVGAVTKVEEIEYGYELTMTLWSSVEFTDGTPSSVILK